MTPQRTISAPRAKLPSIQWLRAIAALMVVFHHIGFHVSALRDPTREPVSDLWSFSSWWFGVHIFFVVSGFIMIHTTRDFGEAGAWRTFLARRLIRIVPMYWIMTSLMVACVLIAPHSLDIAGDRLSYILRSYAFIPSLRAEGDLRPILGHGWTLNYEVFFYVAFAAAVAAPRRLAVGALTGLFLLLAWFGRDLTPADPVLFTWTDGLMFEFLFGAYLALAFQRGWRLPGWAAVASVLTGATLVAMKIGGPSFVSCGVPATLIVGGFVLGPHLSESGATRWLTLLGDASYSLYLTNPLVLRPLRAAWSAALGGKAPLLIFVVVATAASVAVGLIVYRTVERPLTAWLQSRLLGPRAAKAPFPAGVAPVAP